jgi:hypothetical protein
MFAAVGLEQECVDAANSGRKFCLADPGAVRGCDGVSFLGVWTCLAGFVTNFVVGWTCLTTS